METKLVSKNSIGSKKHFRIKIIELKSKNIVLGLTSLSGMKRRGFVKQGENKDIVLIGYDIEKYKKGN